MKTIIIKSNKICEETSKNLFIKIVSN
jgi:hypothetical protein